MSLDVLRAANPRFAVVLGSGLGAVAETLGIEAEVTVGNGLNLISHVNLLEGTQTYMVSI
jgi:hypothetical protein